MPASTRSPGDDNRFPPLLPAFFRLGRKNGARILFLNSEVTRMPHYVSASPDEWDDRWIAVIVEAATNVVYQHQCAGVVCDLRSRQGYLVPLGSSQYSEPSRRIDVSAFRSVFHDGNRCNWLRPGERLPADRLEELLSLVCELPFRFGTADGTLDRCERLLLDETRVGEVVEAWVPVLTPAGRGVLVRQNCD
jgi:hypothetical protein